MLATLKSKILWAIAPVPRRGFKAMGIGTCIMFASILLQVTTWPTNMFVRGFLTTIGLLGWCVVMLVLVGHFRSFFGDRRSD